MKPENIDEVIVEEKIIKVNGDIASRYYTRGKELGKGGFARVYELKNNESKAVTAAKVIQKSSLIKGRTRQKLMSEIKIHRSVHHKGIVNFEHFFEDSENIYILLEICNNGTLNEKLKRRRKLTELEAQCYLLQLLSTLKYLHSLKIVHRDIKLSNLFLNNNMELKLGDFGLACKIEFEGERKRTMCGTPNYIAPEILDGRIGHSFEVDIWSFGIMAYTMLVGKPPYQAEDARATYKRIKSNVYTFPDNSVVSDEAKSLISSILVLDPSSRPSLDQILDHPFFNKNTIPRTLPLSTLAVPPTSNYLKQFEGYGAKSKIQEISPLTPRTDMSVSIRPTLSPRNLLLSPKSSQNKLFVCSSSIASEDHDDLFVEKWVDYSEKYGLGYKLSNTTVGVHFNDSSKMIFAENSKIKYFENNFPNDEDYKEIQFTSYPANLQKKITILQHFNKHLKAGVCKSETMPYIKKWVGTSIANIFRLSNRTVHVIFHDKIELLIQGHKKNVIFLENYSQNTYPVLQISESGNNELVKRMRFTKEILTGMVQK